MTFDNLLGLTRGEFLVKPSISSFENFCFDADKIQRGDLFIAFDKSDSALQTAIENGAYGILCDEELNILDKEIAWIKVQNINMALFRLMRFESSYKKLIFVYVSFLQENILNSMSLPKNAIILKKSTLKAFNQIMKAKDDTFIFCSDDLYLQKIAPVHECIFTQRNTAVQKNGSIFESSFIFENRYYNKIPISPIFIPSLCGILSFLHKYNIEFDLQNFKPILNFDPIFVDTSISPRNFGDTRRALIVEYDQDLFEFEAKRLFKILAPNTLLTCKPIKSKSKLEVNFLYKHEQNLKELHAYNFRYALILGDKEKILQALSIGQNKRYPSLF